MASCVEAGPGSRLVAAMPSSNSAPEIHCRRVTQSRRSSAMCAGGPPKPVIPIHSHCPAMVGRRTVGTGIRQTLLHVDDRVVHRELTKDGVTDAFEGGDLLGGEGVENATAHLGH